MPYTENEPHFSIEPHLAFILTRSELLRIIQLKEQCYEIFTPFFSESNFQWQGLNFTRVTAENPIFYNPFTWFNTYGCASILVFGLNTRICLQKSMSKRDFKTCCRCSWRSSSNLTLDVHIAVQGLILTAEIYCRYVLPSIQPLSTFCLHFQFIICWVCFSRNFPCCVFIYPGDW